MWYLQESCKECLPQNDSVIFCEWMNLLGLLAAVWLCGYLQECGPLKRSWINKKFHPSRGDALQKLQQWILTLSQPSTSYLSYTFYFGILFKSTLTLVGAVAQRDSRDSFHALTGECQWLHDHYCTPSCHTMVLYRLQFLDQSIPEPRYSEVHKSDICSIMAMVIWQDSCIIISLPFSSYSSYSLFDLSSRMFS